MNENLLTECESRTFGKTNNCVQTKLNQKKLWLKLRFFIYIGVIFLFYVNYLWSGGAGKENVPPKQYHSNRQLLSFVSTSTVGLEQPQEVVHTTKAHYYNNHPVEQTSLADVTQPAVVEKGAELTFRTPTDNRTVNCTAPAILQFPTDGLTRIQRQHGWIIIHILLAFYCFWLLAVICDDYFLPAIELICRALHMQADIVGATLMAIATSSPELFMNCVGTFVTNGDIGVGTIVGSSVFNLLAVPACCGLFLGQQCNLRLDWWPVSRDCLMYCMSVLALIATIWDGMVMWYESLLLFLAYFIYMTVMYYNDQVARTARRLVSRYRRKLHYVRSCHEIGELTPLTGHYHTCASVVSYTLATCGNNINNCVSSTNLIRFYLSNSSTPLHSNSDDIERCHTSQNGCSSHTVVSEHSCEEESFDSSTNYADVPWQRVDLSLPVFILRWPITFLLYITLPDSRKHPQAKYLAFTGSILWIAVVSYIVAYVITIIGDTLNIPDSVMGLTILSAGMSIPEAVSSIIVTKQGLSAMGISNAIGSNTFDILLCLSVPWFIKAYFLPNQPDELWVALNSNGLTFSVSFLLASVICLFLTLLMGRFKLNRKIGWICAVMYICFITCAALIELNVFFPVNLPVCDH